MSLVQTFVMGYQDLETSEGTPETQIHAYHTYLSSTISYMAATDWVIEDRSTHKELPHPLVIQLSKHYTVGS